MTTTSQRRSKQDKIRERSDEVFIGRKEPILVFEQHLKCTSPDDTGFIDILNISGDGGWTYLLLNDWTNAASYLQKSWETSSFQEALPPMNLGHIQLLNGDHEKAMELYITSLKLRNSKEAFFKGMEEDYADLKMADHGITRTQYDAILEQLKTQATQ